jgi:hypothetical protein
VNRKRFFSSSLIKAGSPHPTLRDSISSS